MPQKVTTIINGNVIDEVDCGSLFNEAATVREKLDQFNIEVLNRAGVDAGVYIYRPSKMNRPDFIAECEEDMGHVDLSK